MVEQLLHHRPPAPVDVKVLLHEGPQPVLHFPKHRAVGGLDIVVEGLGNVRSRHSELGLHALKLRLQPVPHVAVANRNRLTVQLGAERALHLGEVPLHQLLHEDALELMALGVPPVNPLQPRVVCRHGVAVGVQRALGELVTLNLLALLLKVGGEQVGVELVGSVGMLLEHAPRLDDQVALVLLAVAGKPRRRHGAEASVAALLWAAVERIV